MYARPSACNVVSPQTLQSPTGDAKLSIATKASRLEPIEALHNA